MGDKVIIQSRKNDAVRHLKKLGESTAYRKEQNEFLIEGTKLLKEALQNGLAVKEILYCGERPEFIPPELEAKEAERNIIEFVSSQKTPQNVVCSAEIPKTRGEPELSGAIILENMQDPGNVGTILRTANALGVGEVILIGSCADLWSPKTVRASMGAVFREKCFNLSLDDLKELKNKKKVKVFGAALSEKSADIRSASLSFAAVSIGNEGSGLSDRLLELCDGQIIIPMQPECESLNAAAAAAVVMWEMSRDRL